MDDDGRQVGLVRKQSSNNYSGTREESRPRNDQGGAAAGPDQPMPDAAEAAVTVAAAEPTEPSPEEASAAATPAAAAATLAAAALSTMPAAAVEPTEHSPEAFNDFIRLYESRLTDDEGTSEDTTRAYLAKIKMAFNQDGNPHVKDGKPVEPLRFPGDVPTKTINKDTVSSNYPRIAAFASRRAAAQVFSGVFSGKRWTILLIGA